RGLHEGYLVTPVTKLELIAGFNLSGAIKAVLAGTVLMLGGSLIAGIPGPRAPPRLFTLLVVITVTALALVSLMFLLMVRVNDPLVPRAIFGVLNTVLYFPSGAVYPQEGFPAWLRAIAVVDPFTYAVHALKNLLLKNTGFGAISLDLAYLLAFAAVAMALATVLFRRPLLARLAPSRKGGRARSPARAASAQYNQAADRNRERATEESHMHVGLVMECDYREGRTQEEAFAEAMDIAEIAETEGLDGVWLAERHFAMHRRP